MTKRSGDALTCQCHLAFFLFNHGCRDWGCRIIRRRRCGGIEGAAARGSAVCCARRRDGGCCRQCRRRAARDERVALKNVNRGVDSQRTVQSLQAVLHRGVARVIPQRPLAVLQHVLGLCRVDAARPAAFTVKHRTCHRFGVRCARLLTREHRDIGNREFLVAQCLVPCPELRCRNNVDQAVTAAGGQYRRARNSRARPPR